MAKAEVEEPWDVDDILSGVVLPNSPQSWRNVKLVLKGESEFDKCCVRERS